MPQLGDFGAMAVLGAKESDPLLIACDPGEFVLPVEVFVVPVDVSVEILPIDVLDVRVTAAVTRVALIADGIALRVTWVPVCWVALCVWRVARIVCLLTVGLKLRR